MVLYSTVLNVIVQDSECNTIHYGSVQYGAVQY